MYNNVLFIDHMWNSISPPTVVACERLHNPQNGSVQFSDDHLHISTVATYSCHSGFTLIGNNVRECRANGQWSSEEPYCFDGETL